MGSKVCAEFLWPTLANFGHQGDIIFFFNIFVIIAPCINMSFPFLTIKAISVYSFTWHFERLHSGRHFWSHDIHIITWDIVVAMVKDAQRGVTGAKSLIQ